MIIILWTCNSVWLSGLSTPVRFHRAVRILVALLGAHASPAIVVIGAAVQPKAAVVVFLAERTDTLEIFAEALSRRGHHTNFVVGNQTKGDERAVKAIFGNAPDGFRRITHGKSVESYFRPGGKNAPERPASIAAAAAVRAAFQSVPIS